LEGDLKYFHLLQRISAKDFRTIFYSFQATSAHSIKKTWAEIYFHLCSRIM